MGYDLDVVDTGTGAIQKIFQTHYDIVMTSDVNESYIDGNTIAHLIKRIKERSPIIIGLTDNPRFLDSGLFDGIYPCYLDVREIIDIIKKIDLHPVIA